MIVAIGRGNLHHAAFGRQITLENDEAAIGFDGILEGADHLLSWGLLGQRSFFGESLAADGECRSIRMTSVDEALGQKPRTAGSLIIRSDIFARRGKRANVRRALADDVEIVNGQRNIHLACDCNQVKNGIGRTAAGSHAGDGVLNRLAGDDLRRAAIGADGIHQDAAGFARRGVLVRAGGRNPGKVDGRDAEDFAGHRHRVCCELAAASARAGTRVGLKCFKARIVDAACCVRADALEDVLNGNVSAVQLAGRDGATVKHHPRNVEAAESHDDSRHILVAAANAHEAVEKIAASN